MLMKILFFKETPLGINNGAKFYIVSHVNEKALALCKENLSLQNVSFFFKKLQSKTMRAN